MRTRWLTCKVVLLSLAMSASILDGQIRGSEFSTVSQVVDGTTITVEYSRPQIRGRGAAFGNLVDYGHIWTPGANWATTFEVDQDVEIDGVSVPQGKYSVWMVATPEEMEVVLDPNERIFHTMRPERTESQISVTAPLMPGPATEVLTFSFPVVKANGADLLFQWGESQVSVFVEVQPTAVLSISEELAQMYVGSWKMSWAAPIPREAIPEAERPKAVADLELEYADGQLKGAWDWSERWDGWGLMLVPLADHVFSPGFMLNGELFELDQGLIVEGVVEDGRAVLLEIYDRTGPEEVLIFRAERAN